MTNNLRISWGTGNMVIHLDKFFPTTQDKLKKLIKVIELDWQNQDELKERLKVYFQEMKAECEALFKENGKQYLDEKQKAADLTRLIENKKHPNGLPLNQDEWDAAKKELKQAKTAAKYSLTRAKENKRNVERFKKHFEIVH